MNALLVGRRSHHYLVGFLWYSCEHTCISPHSRYHYTLISSLYFLWSRYSLYWYYRFWGSYKATLQSLLQYVLLSMSRYVDSSRYNASEPHVILCVPTSRICVWPMQLVRPISREEPVSWVNRLHLLSSEVIEILMAVSPQLVTDGSLE